MTTLFNNIRQFFNKSMGDLGTEFKIFKQDNQSKVIKHTLSENEQNKNEISDKFRVYFIKDVFYNILYADDDWLINLKRDLTNQMAKENEEMSEDYAIALARERMLNQYIDVNELTRYINYVLKPFNTSVSVTQVVLQLNEYMVDRLNVIRQKESNDADNDDPILRAITNVFGGMGGKVFQINPSSKQYICDGCKREILAWWHTQFDNDFNKVKEGVYPSFDELKDIVLHPLSKQADTDEEVRNEVMNDVKDIIDTEYKRVVGLFDENTYPRMVYDYFTKKNEVE